MSWWQRKEREKKLLGFETFSSAAWFATCNINNAFRHNRHQSRNPLLEPKALMKVIVIFCYARGQMQDGIRN